MDSRRNWALCEGRTSQSPQASPEESEPKTPFAPEPLDNQSWAAAKPSRVLFKVFPDVSPDRFSKVVVSEVPSFFQMRSNSDVSSQPPDAPLSQLFSPSFPDAFSRIHPSHCIPTDAPFKCLSQTPPSDVAPGASCLTSPTAPTQMFDS